MLNQLAAAFAWEELLALQSSSSNCRWNHPTMHNRIKSSCIRPASIMAVSVLMQRLGLGTRIAAREILQPSGWAFAKPPGKDFSLPLLRWNRAEFLSRSCRSYIQGRNILCVCLWNPPFRTLLTANNWSLNNLFHSRRHLFEYFWGKTLCSQMNSPPKIRSKASNLRTYYKGYLYLLLAWGENLLAPEC